MNEKTIEVKDTRQDTKSLFVVSIVSLIISLFVLSVIFAPIAIVCGAFILGKGDKRGWWGVIGGGIMLLMWVVNLLLAINKL